MSAVTSEVLFREPDAQFIERIRAAALSYVEAGWVLCKVHGVHRDGSCTCVRHECPSVGKHPVYTDWLDLRPTREEVTDWWGLGVPFNVGLVLGAASGVDALDFDIKRGGIETLLEWSDGPITLEQATGGEGRHQLIQHLTDASPKPRFMQGCEFKTTGTQIVLAPSRHRSGRTYEMVGHDRGIAGPDRWSDSFRAMVESTVIPGHDTNPRAVPERVDRANGGGDLGGFGEGFDWSHWLGRPEYSVHGADDPKGEGQNRILYDAACSLRGQGERGSNRQLAVPLLAELVRRFVNEDRSRPDWDPVADAERMWDRVLRERPAGNEPVPVGRLLESYSGFIEAEGVRREVTTLVDALSPGSREYLARLQDQEAARDAKATLDAIKARANGEASGWLDVAAIVAAGVEAPKPPTVMRFADDPARALLYDGRYNALFGDFGQGKSLLLSAIQASYINEGRHVIHLEYDNNTLGQVVWRVIAAGGKPELVAEHLHVMIGEVTVPRFDFEPAFVSLDSVNSAISLFDNVDANSSGKGVDQLVERLLNPFIQRGATALTLDHVNSTDPERPSNNRRKLQAVQGVMLKIERHGDPGRVGTKWLSRLTVKKDNPGWCEVAVDEDIGFAVFDGTAGDGTCAVSLWKTPVSELAAVQATPDSLTEAVFRVVSQVHHGGITRRAVERELTDQGVPGVSEMKVKRALQELYTLGRIDGEKRGTGDTAPWHYRAAPLELD